MTRRLFTSALLAATLAPAARLAGAADPFPSRPVRFVNWSNAGGNMDIVGRMLAEHASRRWRQQVVTDNKTGASGIIATEFVARSTPDGYTVLITSSTGQLTNALIRSNLPYDPVKDFEPLSLLVAGNIALIAAPEAPFGNLRQLVEHARKLGRPLSYGSFGIGTSAHLYGEALARQAGIALTHVPYKTGELGAMTDVIGGALDLSFMSQGNARVQSRAGKVRLLGISGNQRTKSLPELATFDEQGFKGFGLAGWIAAYAPAGTPAPVLAELSAALREGLQQPAIAGKLEELGYEVIGGSPESLRAFYQDEYQRIGDMVKMAGIKRE